MSSPYSGVEDESLLSLDVVDNTSEEQKYYYEDGCFYVERQGGWSMINPVALYPQMMRDHNLEQTDASPGSEQE
ncbi:hypothetical protein [Cedratvirus kamchatka]|uniref:Uncharacterized protein n=1 Tax=Cedratvirus kamchatka TaxID=2716914 RepID=A0A6G8MY36_9VIRU|nr:hypothetical protein [Cedratvirus kamchatka]